MNNFIEEQTPPRFQDRRYYPVKPGDVVSDRYRNLSKLGFGAYSTVWLTRDQKTAEYRSLKVCVQDVEDSSPIGNEIAMLKRLSETAHDHPGSSFVRTADSILKSLWTLQHMVSDAKVPKEIVRDFVHRIIGAVNWLHADCGVVHTEIATQNVVASISNDSVFQQIEEERARHPGNPTIRDGCFAYPSRGQPTSILDLSGDAVHTDFGSARLVDTDNKGWWVADTYRAPEVLMSIPWDHEVDIWSVGILALELLEGRNFFNPIDTMNKQFVLPLAVAQYIGYLGLPPRWMIEKSHNPVTASFFNGEGLGSSDPSHVSGRLRSVRASGSGEADVPGLHPADADLGSGGESTVA